jgi:ABC-type uncharacterized transport system substrate-binding protein
MRRRDFIKATAISVAWPLTARAQQPALPLVGVVSGQSPQSDARNSAAFYKGLSEAGYIDGQNVTVEYHWMEGHYDRLPAVMADLVRRQVSVITTTGNQATALAAKAATATVPIIFAVGQDPVRLGPVASLARPGVIGPTQHKRRGLLLRLRCRGLFTPGGWRDPEVAFEGTVKGGLGLVAHALGNPNQ